MTYALFTTDDLTGSTWFPKYRWEREPWTEFNPVLMGTANRSQRVHQHGAVAVSPTKGTDRSLTFADDFYERIHVTTFELNVGTVVSSQLRTLALWNAWRSYRKVLIDLDLVDAEGISVSGQAPPPVSFAPLQVREYTITITNEGPPIVDAHLIYEFDDGTVLDVNLLGRRAVAWTAVPDWTEPVVERMTFLTDVLEMQYGREQRRRLRIGPRKQYDFAFMLFNQGRRLMENAVLGWGLKPFVVPCWPEGVNLSADVAAGSTLISVPTKGRNYAPGSLVMFVVGPEKYEICEVESVTPGQIVLNQPTFYAWSAGQKMYPAITCTLEEGLQLSRLTGNLSIGQASLKSLESVDLWNEEGTPDFQYLEGYPILTTRPEESEDPITGYERVMVLVESGSGRDFIDDISDLSRISQTHRWLVEGDDKITEFRKLLYYLKGKLKPIWVPTFREDVELANGIQNGDSYITIKPVGFVDLVQGRPGRTHLRIETSSGVLYRKIQSSLEIGELERLFFDEAFTTDYPLNQIVMISFVMLARSESDAFEITYHHQDLLEATLRFKSIIQYEVEEVP